VTNELFFTLLYILYIAVCVSRQFRSNTLAVVMSVLNNAVAFLSHFVKHTHKFYQKLADVKRWLSVFFRLCADDRQTEISPRQRHLRWQHLPRQRLARSESLMPAHFSADFSLPSPLAWLQSDCGNCTGPAGRSNRTLCSTLDCVHSLVCSHSGFCHSQAYYIIPL